MSQPIRVVIVDDSALTRRIITDLLERDPAIQVVGSAADGRAAIALVQDLRPDIVTMDVRMPVMDGLATTEYLMAYCPTPILVLTASLDSHDVDITFKMLGAGALEVIEKPAGSPTELARAGRTLIRRIKVLASVRVVTHLRGRRKALGATSEPAPPAVVPRNIAPTTPAFPLIVIGASTGGPRVVSQVLSGLPRGFGAAVLVVQHIAAGFSAGLAEWLCYTSKLPVRLPNEGQPLRPGEVLVAPDQNDLLIAPDLTIHLSVNPLLLQRPSIDISMQAAAAVFGPRAIGVLLTGMGRDGAYGLLAIKRAGGYTIAQDETTSTIFGMPRAAIHLGAAADVLPAAEIAGRLSTLVSAGQRPGFQPAERGAR